VNIACRGIVWDFEAVGEIELCVLCGREAEQVAHRDYGKGMGLKTKACETARLCAKCHYDLGQGKDYSRDQRRALMDRAIVNTHTALIERGKLRLA
jgi:hypothetical protein